MATMEPIVCNTGLMSSSPGFKKTMHNIKSTFQDFEARILQLVFSCHQEVLLKGSELEKTKKSHRSLYEQYCQTQNELTKLKLRNATLERQHQMLLDEFDRSKNSQNNDIVVKSEPIDYEHENEDDQPERVLVPRQPQATVQSVIYQEIERNFGYEAPETDDPTQYVVKEEIPDSDHGSSATEEPSPSTRSRRKRKRKLPVRSEPDHEVEDSNDDLPHLRAVLNGNNKNKDNMPKKLGVASSLLSALANQREAEPTNKTSTLRAALLEPMPYVAPDRSVLRDLISAPPGTSALITQRNEVGNLGNLSNTDDSPSMNNLLDFAIYQQLVGNSDNSSPVGSAKATTPNSASNALKSVLEKYMTEQKPS